MLKKKSKDEKVSFLTTSRCRKVAIAGVTPLSPSYQGFLNCVNLFGDIAPKIPVRIELQLVGGEN